MKRRSDRAAAATAAAVVAAPTLTPRMVGAIPALLSLYDVSIIYGESVPSIRRKLQAGTFRPLPWDKYPYRWNPADIQRDLSTPRDLRMRNHGRFGEHKLRSAKVESPHNGRKHSQKRSRSR